MEKKRDKDIKKIKPQPLCVEIVLEKMTGNRKTCITKQSFLFYTIHDYAGKRPPL